MTVSFRAWLGQSHDPSTVLELPTGFAAFLAVPGAWTAAEELHTELHRGSVDDSTCLYLAAYKDAWLGMTDQWQHDCVDCGADSTTERYMVHDHVWAAAGMCPFGFLCIGCLERRLGRRLSAADFPDVGLNRHPGYQRSARLVDRLAAGPAAIGPGTYPASTTKEPDMTVVDLTTRTPRSTGIACETCHRTLSADWVVFTGRRWLCGQCLSSEAYDTGFREACRRLGVDVATAVNSHPGKPPQSPTV